MDLLARRDFEQLARIDEPWCVSIHMPTHPTGREVRQDPIRLKNLLKEAEEALAARGLRKTDFEQQLRPLRDLADDTFFWAHQGTGLAAFCTPSETHVYTSPLTPPERVVVGRRAYLVPLIPVLSEEVSYYVLAISPKGVRLIEGNRYSARELDLPGWPDDFDELAAFIEEQRQLQFHTEAQSFGPASERAAVFHGHTGEDAESQRKQRLLEYCRMIDERVTKAIGENRKPLILACDQRLAPIYREATDYPLVFDEPLTGNPDQRRAEELCVDAWELIGTQVEAARDDAVQRYQQAAGHGMAATDLAAVLKTAYEGRIETLLVDTQRQCWGQYDPQQPRLDVHDEPGGDDDDLLNLALVVALDRGASVFRLEQEELPSHEPAVGILRY